MRSPMLLLVLALVAPAPVFAAQKPATLSQAAALTRDQKTAAAAAMKALLKLEAATELHAGFASYTDLLIDAAAEIRLQSLQLPESTRQVLAAALAPFADAHVFWEAASLCVFARDCKELEEFKLLGKYRIAWRTEDDQTERNNHAWQFFYLSGIWNDGSLKLRLAEQSVAQG
jgi:hypothetical protein